jgi:hypothetical protein
LTIAFQPYKSLVNFVEFHNPGVAMSQRDQALIADWESRPLANALAVRILGQLNERKAEVERCALDGLQRENQQFERAASPQFRAEAFGHCNDILKSMLAIASGSARAQGDEPFHFVASHAVRRARQQFPLAGSLNAYRPAHRGYWEVMRSSVLSAPAVEGEKSDCLMLFSEFLLEFFDRISRIMTDAYIAEEKRMIARRTRAHVALVEDLLHGRPWRSRDAGLVRTNGHRFRRGDGDCDRADRPGLGRLADRPRRGAGLAVEDFPKSAGAGEVQPPDLYPKGRDARHRRQRCGNGKTDREGVLQGCRAAGTLGQSRNQPRCAGNIGAAAGLSGGRARGRVRDEDPADHAFLRKST